jgi:uncharacterized protein YbjQ (UPF0145 family)
MLVLTIDHAPGHRVHAILGEVIGATVRPDNPYVEGVKSLDGQAAQIQAVIRTRQDAVQSMVEHARRLGANAIIGMRFDHRSVGGGWFEICAYGTAIVLSARRGTRQPAT